MRPCGSLARVKRSFAGVRGFLVLLCFAWATGAVAQGPGGRAPEPNRFPGGAAAYYVERQGEPLWSYRADRALPPASLTKIMTALLVLESGRPLDDVVTVSANAQRETGARLSLRGGERMRLRDLLAATLLASANDACLALAEHVGGDGTRFVASMNARARELGLARTRFTNPCGHDAPGHSASAVDLAKLTKAALRQPLFRELAQAVQLRIATLEGREFRVENRNELIGRYAGAIGVKSGFTARAGKCLVALAQRDGVTVLLVVLNAPDRWWGTEEMLDRAFAQPPPTQARVN